MLKSANLKNNSEFLFHVFCYYLTWFACLIFAANHEVWSGPVVGLSLIAIQLFILIKAKQTKGLIQFILIFGLTGVVVDSILINIGFIVFMANPFTYIAPPWIITIWLSFAIVTFACMKKYFKYLIGLGILSLIGFPLAYAAGLRLEAAFMPLGYPGTLIFGLIWCILLPTLIVIYKKIGKSKC